MTHVILHRHVFSGKAQVGVGNAGLDDHLLQELGVHLSVRPMEEKERIH